MESLTDALAYKIIEDLCFNTGKIESLTDALSYKIIMCFIHKRL